MGLGNYKEGFKQHKHGLVVLPGADVINKFRISMLASYAMQCWNN